jgi:penicillin-binding protein 1A
VRLSEQVGRKKVQAAAARLGVAIDGAPDAAIALGAYETTLIALTGAYATLVDDGVPPIAHGIVEIRDGSGRSLYRRQGSGAGEAISRAVQAQLDGLLQGVVRDGTGRSARLDRPAAGKTGTTSDYRDAWFIGYTADLVAGVWVGNDDSSPMNKVVGGGLPAQIWRQFMTEALAGVPPRALPAQALTAAVRPPPSAGGGLFERLREFLSGEGAGQGAILKPSTNIDDDPTFRRDRP